MSIRANAKHRSLMRGHEFAGLFIGKGKKVDGGLDSLPSYTDFSQECDMFIQIVE